MDGQVNHNTLAFIRRANVALDKWWHESDELHRPYPLYCGRTMSEVMLTLSCRTNHGRRFSTQKDSRW